MMAMTREQMDRKIDEHFGFEATDDVEGVLATLAPDVEHDIVGWPTGPTHGRAAARAFYEAMFADLSESKVVCVKRLYGDNFLVDEFDLEWKSSRQALRIGRQGPATPISTPAYHRVRREWLYQTRKCVDRSRRNPHAAAAGLM